MWKCKSTKIGKTILNMKNKVGGLILTDFKIYFKTAVIKKEWCWCLDRHIEQWNRRVIPERDPPVCGYFIFVKDSSAIQSGETMSFQLMMVEPNIHFGWIINCKPYLILYSKLIQHVSIPKCMCLF